MFKSIEQIMRSLPKPTEKMIDARKIVSDPKVQIRIRPGESGLGFVAQFTTTRVEKMKVDIAAVGRVLEPLTVWEKADGSYTALRGNTRLQAVHQLLDDDSTPQSVVKAIEKLKCVVYKDLTEQQAIALIDDQSTVSPYTKVDIVNLIKRELQSDLDWRSVCLSHVHLLKKHFFKDSEASITNMAKLYAAKSVSEQLAVIETWMTGSVRQGVLDAMKLGDRVWKAFCLTLAQEDGLLADTMEKAEFNPKTRIVSTEKGNKQTRIARLKAIKGEMELARSKDKSLPAWDSNEGAFYDEIEKFIMEDKGELEVPKNIQRATAMQLKELKNDKVRSTAFKVAYAVALGEKPTEAADADANAYRCEMVMGKASELLTKVTEPTAAAVLAIVVHSSNAGEFEKAMSKYIG